MWVIYLTARHQTSRWRLNTHCALCTILHQLPSTISLFLYSTKHLVLLTCLSTKRKTQWLNTLNKQITEILNVIIQTNRSLLNREESIAYKHRGPLVSKSICSMLFCPLGWYKQINWEASTNSLDMAVRSDRGNTSDAGWSRTADLSLLASFGLSVLEDWTGEIKGEMSPEIDVVYFEVNLPNENLAEL